MDHERICKDLDRTATPALLDAFQRPDAPEEEWREAGETLLELEDPRSWGPLLELLEDRAFPEERREVAGDILRSGYWTAEPEVVRRWWRSGDRPLRRHALLCMGLECVELVESVARDPAHPLYREAIHTLYWGFDLPRFQQYKVQALSHPDPAVRRMAADVLVFDEPLIAQEPLISALRGLDQSVAMEAARTLKYYETQRTWLALDDMGRWGSEDVAREARESADALRGSFVSAARRCARIRDWLVPIWKALAVSAEELREPPDPPTRPQELVVPPVERILELLGRPDRFAELRDLLYSVTWGRYEGQDRERLREALPSHTEPLVRSVAARALSTWGDQELLFGLAHDPCCNVRKSAMYYLGETPPHTPRVAAIARECLADPEVTGTRAGEALRTYVRAADRAEAVPWLRELAGDLERGEGLRASAIRLLADFGAREEVRSLLPLLLEPPPVTWALHNALLDAAGKLGLAPPGLDRLAGVDDLDLQEALAPFLTPSGPGAAARP